MVGDFDVDSLERIFTMRFLIRILQVFLLSEHNWK